VIAHPKIRAAFRRCERNENSFNGPAFTKESPFSMANLALFVGRGLTLISKRKTLHR